MAARAAVYVSMQRVTDLTRAILERLEESYSMNLGSVGRKQGQWEDETQTGRRSSHLEDVVSVVTRVET